MRWKKDVPEDAVMRGTVSLYQDTAVADAAPCGQPRPTLLRTTDWNNIGWDLEKTQYSNTP
jgi:hypothetical protein